MIEPDVFEADREWAMPLTEGEWGKMNKMTKKILRLRRNPETIELRMQPDR